MSQKDAREWSEPCLLTAGKPLDYSGIRSQNVQRGHFLAPPRDIVQSQEGLSAGNAIHSQKVQLRCGDASIVGDVRLPQPPKFRNFAATPVFNRSFPPSQPPFKHSGKGSSHG